MELHAAYEPGAREALVAFGVEAAELSFVNLSENITFKVIDARDGAPLVLRLHRPWYHDLPALKSEHLWTRALVEAGLAAPEPLLTLAGEDFARVDFPALGESRWAGLARWVDGELLSLIVEREPDVTANARHFERLGRIIGSMHNQAVGWLPPPEFIRHRLDENGLMGEAPFWGPFWDHAILSSGERDLLLTTRDRLHAALVRYGTRRGTFSLIHADLHPRNVVIAGADAAVIDFDDSAFGWHQYDLAAALISYRFHVDFAAFTAACVAGYRSVRSLSDEDLALLPMFLLVRGMAQLGWFHQRPELGLAAAFPKSKDAVCAAAAGFEPLC